jgi:tetratricopeptide (TPR) repeat protein
MARYDRIARLPVPARREAFPCWGVLADLEGRDRDPDLLRRGRLRFLALRPVHRVLTRGDAVTSESYAKQLEGVREELGHLSARDPERHWLSRFLHQIEDRTPGTLAMALLDLGQGIASEEHDRGAKECFLLAQRAAAQGGAGELEARAKIGLGDLAQAAGNVEQSRELYGEAAALALEHDARLSWARAAESLAELREAEGDGAGAAETYRAIMDRGEAWPAPEVRGIGAFHLSQMELHEGNPLLALEYGIIAADTLRRDEERRRVFVVLGGAFSLLGAQTTAEQCYDVAFAITADDGARLDARARRAAAAAHNGDAPGFEERREALLRDALALQLEPVATASMHLELGRGALLLGHTQAAHDHLEEARNAAGNRLEGVRRSAEELLQGIESAATARTASRRPPDAPVDRLHDFAARVDRLATDVIAKSSAN